MASQPQGPQAQPQPGPASEKPIHSLVLDAAPLIKNDPPVSSLLAKADELYTTPSVLEELRDEETRARVDTMLRPFLKLRSPKSESLEFVAEFAKKTGDRQVLSRTDLQLIALVYELDCERNGGDERLRKTPFVAKKEEEEEGGETTEVAVQKLDDLSIEEHDGDIEAKDTDGRKPEDIENQLSDTKAPTEESAEDYPELEASEDSDSDGWITPSNLKKHQARDAGKSTASAPAHMPAALLTHDYAMQNVSLRIGLNIVSAGISRITRINTYVNRCHGCFAITRDMERQFCPRCGQPTLMRASCSTDENGEFKVHLKRNFQWNNRGNVYSVPKPTHGTPSGKLIKGMGGGKNGWGRNLILAEDQKEFTREGERRRREKKKDLMDEDYLPGLLGGERNAGGGRIKVGAGRSVNSRKSRR